MREKGTFVPHRILLVQNDPSDADAIHKALAQSADVKFEIEWVKRCSEAIDRLAEENDPADGSRPGATQPGESPRISAILVDLFLPDSSGIETFHRIFHAAPQIPILVLISPAQESVAKTAVQFGAQDYLLKSRIDSYLLPKSIANMIERALNAEALFEEKERAQVTLNSIGDAVMSTDAAGRVTFLNGVAERLTGWSLQEAAGRAVHEVFHIIDAISREPVNNPMDTAIAENKIVGLTPNCMLVRRDGVESAIEDSAAPIHDRHGVVTGAVMVFHDVSSARAMSQRMSHLAQHDSLTELPNRILLNDRLQQGLAAAQRRQQRLALLFLDMDRFKTINDSMGHAAGDRLLQSAAQRLTSCVRASDTVSRQGGDEFVVLLSEVGEPQDAAVCAEKILAAFAEPHEVEHTALYVTFSIGIVTYPEDGLDAATLLQNADLAMYQAKSHGRNCYQFFAAGMNVAALQRQSVESALRQAIDREEFVLHFQPKRDLSTGAITSLESLLRWNDPARGMVPPAQFMAVAEESGLIVPIGRWVLREACRQGAAWRDAGLSPIFVAVNVSAVELRSKNFIAGVRTILKETGFDPKCLEIELTETYLMRDPQSTATVLEALKMMGVGIALDDFGTGYSSLSYMRRFPVDTLKIDESFVRNLISDSDDAGIVVAVINMGKSMHMRVVAEGVETATQLAFLQEQGCPEGQGYFLGRPAPAQEIGLLLSATAAVVAANAWDHARRAN